MSMNAQRPSIAEIVHHIGHLLPSQGPIDVFIHHNTLHSFENLPFEVAVDKASEIYGARSYWKESRYQSEYRRGRISDRDLDDILSRPGDRAQVFIPGINVSTLRRLALIVAPQAEERTQVEWILAESSETIAGTNEEQHRALIARDTAYLRDPEHTMHVKELEDELIRTFGSLTTDSVALDVLHLEEARANPTSLAGETKSRDFLWLVCLHEASRKSQYCGSQRKEITPSLRAQFCPPAVLELVNPYLIRLASSFLDQGLGRWHLEGRSKGFFGCFVTHMGHRTIARPWWLKAINQEAFDEIIRQGPEYVVEQELIRLGVPESQWQEYLLETALELRGWSGFMNLFELRPDLLPLSPTSHQHALLDFLAVKLILERFAADTDMNSSSFQLESQSSKESSEGRTFSLAYHMFLICRKADIGASDLLKLSANSRALLRQILAELPRQQRRRVWHQAYELHFQKRVYRALCSHQNLVTKEETERPIFQIVFCIDDREESIRRYFEEHGSDFETFGTAGFFAIDAEFTPLGGAPAASCPVVIKPTHRINEVAGEGHENELSFRTSAANLVHRFEDIIGDASRTPLRGLLVSLTGLAALFPWMLKTLFPQISVATAKATERLFSEDLTDVQYLTAADAKAVDGISIGYTVDEMVTRVEAVLRTIGLINNFGRLIVIMGHGSLSRNNPYRSAYDCGACGGRPGKMNPRVFARMANMPEVRTKLAERGIVLTDSTWFVGAFHNTTSDQIRLFDRELIPKSFDREVVRLIETSKICCGKNALERARRFELSGATSVAAAVRHVEARTHHIAEPRPEYGHATNAICIIGRRSLTRGLFLDRRSFLVSYDSELDSKSKILESILGAVVPVCMGINLEYFFSAIDNDVYGAGSKLPQNVAGFIGMMTGNISDLRTGLPQQMIEIHEPVRLVMIIETTPDEITELLSRNAMLKRVFLNQWIILAVYDRSTNSLLSLEKSGDFTPFTVSEEQSLQHPVIGSSLDWCQGLDGPLPFASVQLH